MDSLRQLLEALHRRSPMQGVTVDWSIVDRLLGTSIASGSTFVDDDKGQLRGLIVAAAIPLWWNRDMLIGQDIFFYSTRMRGGLQLLKAAVEWCRQHRARRLQFGISSFRSPDSVASLYLSAGFRREGSFFVMEN